MDYHERRLEKGDKIVSVWLSPREALNLDLLASAGNTSRAQLIRDALEHYSETFS